MLEVFKRPSANVKDKVSSIMHCFHSIWFIYFRALFYNPNRSDSSCCFPSWSSPKIVRPMRSLRLVCKPLQTISNTSNIKIKDARAIWESLFDTLPCSSIVSFCNIILLQTIQWLFQPSNILKCSLKSNIPSIFILTVLFRNLHWYAFGFPNIFLVSLY